MKLIVEGQLVEDEELKLIAETPEGCLRIQQIIKSTVVAFAMDNVHAYLLTEAKALKRQLSYEEMTDVCNIVWHCFFQRKSQELDDYVDACAKRIQEEGWMPTETVH